MRALLPVVAVLTLFVVVYWQLQLLGDVQLDDAFITFSFSKNLALGHGPVYSHLVRVEGYSNFLWMLIIAVPLAVRPNLDPLLIARVLTVPFALLLGWATYSLIRTPYFGLRSRRIVAWAGVILLALDTDIVLAGICGLETLPYIALVVAAFALYMKGLEGSRRAQMWTVPTFVAVALMRIDGVIPLLFILAWELAYAVIQRRFVFGKYLRWALPGIAVYAVWFAWRWQYYGQLLPNTYYAKALVPIALPHRGFEYARDFWTSSGLYLALPFVLVALWHMRARAIVLLLFICGHTAYVIHVGGDWMPFWRFFGVIVPLVTILMAWGAERGIRWASNWQRDAGEASVAVALFVAVCVGYHLDDHYVGDKVKREKVGFAQMLGPTMLDEYRPMSRLLNFVVPPGKRLVSDYAGTMAYFTDAAVIDMWGLANEEIAHQGNTDGVVPIWGRTCPPCYKKLAPDFFHVKFMEPVDKYGDHRSVVQAVWQSDTIGKYIDFNQFVAGRAVDLRSNRAIYFLERRRPRVQYVTRRPTDGIVIEYPFERPLA